MEERVAKTFATRVRQRNLGRDLNITYHVFGGMPSQRVEYTVKVNPADGVKVEAHERRTSSEVKRGLLQPQDFDVVSLFDQVVAGLHSLAAASQAAFPPDALVGSLTISVDNREETFYFVPEKEKRKMHESRLAPQIDNALSRLWGVAKRISESERDTNKGAEHEGS